ncbi:MAG: toll/interleukin-1 receptor domain-containing protein, partial [Clostridia bacterium]|nr:toll/interleukin-1 receptor domain-containing protein [Clostridia bacterium]
MSEYVYDAFISYSHRDLEWGKKLQRKLEGYRLPRALSREKNGNVRLKIFRDQTDLAGAELKESLTRELERSRYLIVICSPASAASRWVDDEIRTFCAMGRANRVIPFIIDGEPMSDRPELECFPPALRDMEDAEPLGVNIQEIGAHKAMLKAVSVLLDVRFDRLVNREKQRRRRTILVMSSVILAVGALVGGLLIRNVRISRENREMSYDIYTAAIKTMKFKNDVLDSVEPEEFALIQLSAESGNPYAMLYLADCLLKGVGTEADPEAAFAWYQRAADTGSTQGMVALIYCYGYGTGTTVNPKMVFYWSIKGAEAGNTEAMMSLGHCYEDGYGTEKNMELAFQWYQRAAEENNDYGIFYLAACYRWGDGTEENHKLAFECLRK